MSTARQHPVYTRRTQPRPPQRRDVQVQRAQTDPQPAPRARGYFVQQIWDTLGLDAALVQVGIAKGGLPFSTILIVVILMGVLGAASLADLTRQVVQDAALCAMLGLHALDEKVIYRGLATITLAQYQAWMGQLLRALQADPRTASRPDGVVAGDSTQVAKPGAHKIPGVHVLFLHSEQRFVSGADILTTHYADLDKDYPLYLDFYEPDAATVAARATLKARKQAQVDGRKPQALLAFIQAQIAAGAAPLLTVLSGPQLSPILTAGLTQAGVAWVGVSDQRRRYTLAGHPAPQKAKALLHQPQRHWQTDPDLGYRFALLGAATSSVGAVMLVVAEHMADGVGTLYVLPAGTDGATAITRITEVLSREQQQQAAGQVQRMLTLLRLSRAAGIRAETATFDRWFFIPWFITAVLALGFKRVVIKAKEGFTYTYAGREHRLQALWAHVPRADFTPVTHRGHTYHIAPLIVTLTGVGQVKLVFVRQRMRGRMRWLESVIMCTDVTAAPDAILRWYLLRWRIEVCYREVKQHHGFGAFHAQTHTINYGQTMLSLVAYLFVSLVRLLVPALRERTLGWIRDSYLNAIVRLVIVDDGAEPHYLIEVPGWLLDDYGVPAWDTFRLPPPMPEVAPRR
jgi:hypothetical protein